LSLSRNPSFTNDKDGYRFAPPSQALVDRIAFSIGWIEDEAFVSDSVTTIETADIPGELRLSNPVPPPITVPLPVVTWPQGLKNVLLGLFTLPIGAMFLLFPVALVLRTHAISLSLIDCFIFLVAFPLFLFAGVSCTGAGLTCFWDAVRSGPVLEIAADGLRDRRSGLSVPWSSVRCARILSNFSVDLKLRGPVTNWQNPFRVGVLLHRYRPRPDHVIVSIGYLDVRWHILAYTILTLTQWNGGEAISRMPGPAFDMGLKLIARRRG
jgi:hypothetical protein